MFEKRHYSPSVVTQIDKGVYIESKLNNKKKFGNLIRENSIQGVILEGKRERRNGMGKQRAKWIVNIIAG